MNRITKIALALLLALTGSALLAGETASATDAPAPAAQQVPSGTHLGVGVEALPPAVTAQLPPAVSSGQGVLIVQVEPGSPAKAAGLEPYDVLLSYDDQKLFSSEQLYRLVEADQPGRSVVLQLVRGGQVQTIPATLGRRAATPQPWQVRPFHFPRHVMPDQWRDVVRERFESLKVEKLDNDRYRAAIEYLDADGKKRSHVFEGTLDELHKQIAQSKELPQAARKHLFNALSMRGGWPMPRFWVPLDFEELMRTWREGGWMQY